MNQESHFICLIFSISSVCWSPRLNNHINNNNNANEWLLLFFISFGFYLTFVFVNFQFRICFHWRWLRLFRFIPCAYCSVSLFINRCNIFLRCMAFFGDTTLTRYICRKSSAVFLNVWNSRKFYRKNSTAKRKLPCNGKRGEKGKEKERNQYWKSICEKKNNNIKYGYNKSPKMKLNFIRVKNNLVHFSSLRNWWWQLNKLDSKKTTVYWYIYSREKKLISTLRRSKAY